MEAPGVYVVGKEKLDAMFICSPRSQPFRFSRSCGRAVSSVQHLNLGIDTGDDQRFFEESVCECVDLEEALGPQSMRSDCPESDSRIVWHLRTFVWHVICITWLFGPSSHLA